MQGIQLATEKTSGHFNHLSLSDPATPLVESFARTREALSLSTSAAATVDRESESERAEVGPLVVLDDLSALVWMGHDLRDVLRFWNGLWSLLEPVSHSASRSKGSVFSFPLNSAAYIDFLFSVASLERPSSRYSIMHLLPLLELKRIRSIPTSSERCCRGPISGCRWNRSEVQARRQARCVDTSLSVPKGRSVPSLVLIVRQQLPTDLGPPRAGLFAHPSHRDRPLVWSFERLGSARATFLG